MKANRKRKPLEPYLPSGLVQCAACGSPIIGSRAGGGHRYYYCSRKRENCCKCGLRVDETEAAVLSTMRKAAISMDERRMREIFSSMLVPHQAHSRQLESDLRRELAECRGRQRKLIEALETGAVTVT